MTVVARGAAVYASSNERSKGSVQIPAAVGGNSVGLKLAYDPVSSEQNTTVAGCILTSNGEVEVKLDSSSGLWTSGWIKPRSGIFEVKTPLQLGEVTTFWVYARNNSGQALDVDIPEFKIRHGLVPSAPPLPHTLSIE